VVGIKEGRLLFANLKKSIAYTLAHTMPEVYPVLLYTVFGWPEPINAILLLLIDLLTELVPALSLAFEKPEKNIMNMPPRNVHKEKLVSLPLLGYSYLQAGTVITMCCLFVYFRVSRILNYCFLYLLISTRALI
jgi:sodium/potassium-transporting ATPase subunit alpha